MSLKPTSRGLANQSSGRLKSLCMILTACVAGGCGAGDGLDRRAISGSVTLDGQPLSEGTILLEPVTDRSGTAVGATIRRGAFAITREQGPVPGSYRARIYASSGVQDPPGKGQTERTRRPMVELIPDVYNTRSDLRADVSDRGENHFKFDLHSEDRSGSRFRRGVKPSPSPPRLVFRQPRGLPRWETGDEASP